MNANKAVLALSSCGLAILVALTFTRYRDSFHLSADAAQSRQEILKFIPLGSKVQPVKAIMERQGFVCKAGKSERFARFLPGKQSAHSVADYLYCDREQGFIVRERWQVFVVHQNGRVADVRVSYGLIGS